MQKPLNTPSFALYLFWQRILLLNRKAGLLAGLTLLLLAGWINPAMAGPGSFRQDYVNLTVNGGNRNSYITIRYDDFFSEPFNSKSYLGSFDRNQKILLGGLANTINDEGYDVSSVQLLYRVYEINTTAEDLMVLPYATLVLAAAPADGSVNPSNSKDWSNNTTNPNLLSATNGPGRYVLELLFKGEVASSTDGSNKFSIFDANGNDATNYKTTFDVSANSTPPVSWTGKTNADWFEKTNWLPNSVPNEFTDVTIPLIKGGNVPSIDNNTSGSTTAKVRTLRLAGNSRSPGVTILKLVSGVLQVYGDFQDANGGFKQTVGSVFTLAGVTQTFDGEEFTDIRIQGGGTKTLTRRMGVSKSLGFFESGGILVTRPENSTFFNVDLGIGSRIEGENESSYVLGVLRSPDRTIQQNQLNDFGNIGVELLATDGLPGSVIVIRRTGFVYEGVGTSTSIARTFNFTPEYPKGLNFTLTFHYRDAELGGIKEENLLLFSSEDGTIPFINLNKTTADPAFNTLTRTYINESLSGSFTLGDRLNPLPVTVTSFTAVAQGADAVLDWATATEKNSQGFEVQVSTDARTYRKLGFVTSTANSSTPRSYQYRDATAGKTGTRYYRLRQLDLDGKEAFIGPKAVAFGAPTVASVQGYPNPFGAEINLELQAIAGGPATVSLLDGLGRQVRSWQPTLAAGASRLSLPGLQSLARGLYVVQVRYSDGQTQRLKLVKE